MKTEKVVWATLPNWFEGGSTLSKIFVGKLRFSLGPDIFLLQTFSLCLSPRANFTKTRNISLYEKMFRQISRLTLTKRFIASVISNSYA